MMKVNFEFNKDFIDPFVTIFANYKTTSLVELGQAIHALTDTSALVGYRDDQIKNILLVDVVRFHTVGRDVMCETSDGDYVVHHRLNELVEMLPERLFIRISNSEIVKISSIQKFTLSKAGMFVVNLTNGLTTYASRRYTQKMRRRLLK